MNSKNQKQIYIIEHLEPQLWDWCLIEYEYISKIVGKNNLWITNIKSLKDRNKLEKFSRVFFESIRDLNLDNKRTCILDPEVNKILLPSEKDNFDYFIFGGILGDYPPKKRTTPELTVFFKNSSVRNIGKEQMSTDNAVYTVKQIMNGKKFEALKFQDKVSLKLGRFEFVDLPYRYNLVRGKPLMSLKIKKYLKEKGVFR